MEDGFLINWFIISILTIYYWLYIIYIYFKYKDTYMIEDEMLFAAFFNIVILFVLWCSLCFVVNYFYFLYLNF